MNADDFGSSPQVNAAVLRAYREGVLRYASLMVKRPASEEAAALARQNPGLGVGLHVELCRSHPAAWGLRYFFRPSERGRLEGEIRSQIEKALSWGVLPTHIDGHFNLHVHPTIFPVMVRLAKAYGIGRIRIPGGELSLCLGYERRDLAGRLGLAATYGALGAYLRPRADGLVVPERSFGLLRSGLMGEDYLLWLIRRLPEGLTEIYLHPSSDPASAVGRRPTATHQTLSELKALLSPRVREALREAGATLVAQPQAPPLSG